MKITIYTVTPCQFSQQEKEYLKAHNLPFEEKNLETNKEFLTEMLAVSNNFAGTPVTKVEKDDGQIVVLKGFTKEEFDQTLGLTSSDQPQKPPVEPVQQPASPPSPVAEPQPTTPQPPVMPEPGVVPDKQAVAPTPPPMPPVEPPAPTPTTPSMPNMPDTSGPIPAPGVSQTPPVVPPIPEPTGLEPEVVPETPISTEAQSSTSTAPVQGKTPDALDAILNDLQAKVTQPPSQTA